MTFGEATGFIVCAVLMYALLSTLVRVWTLEGEVRNLEEKLNTVMSSALRGLK